MRIRAYLLESRESFVQSDNRTVQSLIETSLVSGQTSITDFSRSDRK